MQINFRETSLDLSKGSVLMGIIELDPREPFDPSSIQKQAQEFFDCGAIGVELGIKKFSGVHTASAASAGYDSNKTITLAHSAKDAIDGSDPCTCGDDPVTNAYNQLSVLQRADVLSQACEAVLSVDKSAIVAIYTSEATVMEKTVAAGAQLIIDPMSLREPGALETVARLKVNVCLCFDQCYRFDEDDKTDVCGKISEFFYERLDACINAKIARNRIMLDPTLNQKVGVDYRIKLQGRLKSFNSFALPLSCELPRVFPGSDEFLRNNMSVTVAVALFISNQGFHIIRTKNVYDLGLALDTWQALEYSARPFKVRQLISMRLKNFKKKNK